MKIAVIPSIMSDEALYFDLAQSLYAGGGVLFRGQRIAYQYIGYPLLIAPLFALPESLNVYQMIVLWNCFAINAMIFPIYALGVEITKKPSAALALAVLVPFMPDMFMAKHVMAESAAYPLLATGLLLACRALRAPGKTGRQFALGLGFAVLYSFKPGYAALGGVYAIVCLVAGLRGKDKRRVVAAVASAAGLLAGIAAWRALSAWVFRVDFSVSALYAEQTASFSLAHIVQSAKGLLAYVGFTILAFGALPIAFASGAIGRMEGERKLFAWVILLSGLAMLAGCAYVIYYDEFLKSANVPLRIHTRYVAFLLPVLAMYLQVDELRGAKLRAPLIAATAVLALCLVIFPDAMLRESRYYVVDSALLTRYLYGAEASLAARLTRYVTFACILGLSSWIAWKGVSRASAVATVAFVAALLLTNAFAMGYADQYAMNPYLNADAAQTAYMTDGDAVYVCDAEDMFEYPTVALEVNSRCAISPVSDVALRAATGACGELGDVMPDSLSSFVYTKAVSAYARPRYLILKPDLLNRILLGRSTEPATFTRNEYYAVVELPEDGRWVHSGLFGLKQNWVWTDSSFMLYDAETLAQGEVTLYLKVRAGVDGATLTLRADGQEFVFTPSPAVETQWISATFAVAEGAEALRVDLKHAEGNIYVETYRIA